MLRHGASVRAYDTWADVVGLRHGDRYLIINPFFHAFGLKAGILASLIKGATIIPHAVFDVPSVMQRVAEERVSMLPGPPAIYQTILDHPDLASFDLSTLRLAVTGSATVPVEMIRRMRRELPFQNIVTGYGLTETHGISTMCRHDDDDETIAYTAGRPIPGMELRIVDDKGRDLAVGQPGEVLLRGYNLMTGYYDEPEATATTISADGWLATGDIGVVDDRGNLRITDRSKDMFITGGFNAYPAEIENILMNHPGIGQVAVIGIPDHRLGEVGMAWVVPRSGVQLEPDEIIAWARENMANFKAPRRVAIVDALPLNASGKVLKFELRTMALGRPSGRRLPRHTRTLRPRTDPNTQENQWTSPETSPSSPEVHPGWERPRPDTCTRPAPTSCSSTATPSGRRRSWPSSASGHPRPSGMPPRRRTPPPRSPMRRISDRCGSS